MQAQLRNFIPEMLRFSTGKSKPGWGKPECRPLWWPPDVPWANVRSDVREEEEKKLVTSCLTVLSFLHFHPYIQTVTHLTVFSQDNLGKLAPGRLNQH